MMVAIYESMFGTSAELLWLRTRVQVFETAITAITKGNVMYIISVGHKDKQGDCYGREASEIKTCVALALEECGPGAIKLDAAQVVDNVLGVCPEFGVEGNSLVLCFGARDQVERLALRLRDSQRQACVAVTFVESSTSFV